MNSLNHIAIIMDGNGRWGLKNKKSRNLGHKAGLKTVEMIIKESIKKTMLQSLIKVRKFHYIDYYIIIISEIYKKEHI